MMLSFPFVPHVTVADLSNQKSPAHEKHSRAIAIRELLKKERVAKLVGPNFCLANC